MSNLNDAVERTLATLVSNPAIYALELLYETDIVSPLGYEELVEIKFIVVGIHEHVLSRDHPLGQYKVQEIHDLLLMRSDINYTFLDDENLRAQSNREIHLLRINLRPEAEIIDAHAPIFYH